MNDLFGNLFIFSFDTLLLDPSVIMVHWFCLTTRYLSLQCMFRDDLYLWLGADNSLSVGRFSFFNRLRNSWTGISALNWCGLLTFNTLNLNEFFQNFLILTFDFIHFHYKVLWKILYELTCLVNLEISLFSFGCFEVILNIHWPWD